MSEEKLGICVVGCGRAGMIHARNVARRIAGAELVAVVEPNAEALAAAREELAPPLACASFEEALTNRATDAAVIATPTASHEQIAVAAAGGGKHVFLEKPMALTAAGCDRINEAVAAAGVTLQIGFMRRFDASYLRAKELLDGGQLGRVMIVKSTGRGPGGPGPWMWDLSKSNGIIAEVNSHDLDSLRWFSGGRAVRVYAEAHNFKVPEAREKFPGFYDNVVATFRFDNDCLGVVDGTCPAGYGYDARVEILCEKGVIFIGSTQQQGVWHVTVDGEAHGRAVPTWRTLFRDAYLAEMQHFVDCVRDGRPPAVTGADGRAAVEMVVAVNESIRTGRPVVPGGVPG